MKICVYTKSSYFTVFRNNAAEIEIVPKSHLHREKEKKNQIRIKYPYCSCTANENKQ